MTPKGGAKPTRILRKGSIRFYRKCHKLTHNSIRIHLVDKVSPTFSTQKNGVKNETVTQWQKGKPLCPVQIWSDIISILELYPVTSDNTPLNTVWVENHKTTITSQMKIKVLRSWTLSFGEEHLGFSHKEIVTHSLQSVFYMDIFLAGVYPETIIIIGRWSINEFLR